MMQQQTVLQEMQHLTFLNQQQWLKMSQRQQHSKQIHFDRQHKSFHSTTMRKREVEWVESQRCKFLEQCFEWLLGLL
jgi:hypothetical protein